MSPEIALDVEGPVEAEGWLATRIVGRDLLSNDVIDHGAGRPVLVGVPGTDEDGCRPHRRGDGELASAGDVVTRSDRALLVV